LDSSNTLFVGKVLKQFASLASTNDYALLLLSKSKPSEGTVISTLNQYQGRGQIGSTWESEAEKNINFSLILYPTFLPVKDQFQLNQAMSLGVRDFVAEYLLNPVKVKWSNDIYVREKKVAGILIQNSLMGSQIRASVIGIGINVNQTEFVSNPHNPTSFKLETGTDFDLEKLGAALCHCLEQRYLKLKFGQADAIQSDYLNHLYRYRETALFQRPNGIVFIGEIIGISETGKLGIRSDNEIEYFATKEIRFL